MVTAIMVTVTLIRMAKALAGRRRRGISTRAGLFTAAAFMSGLAVAQTAAPTGPQASISLGFGHSDNLNRDETNAVSSDITRLQVGFAGSVDRLRLRGMAAGDLQYRDYAAEESAVDSEVLGSVDGWLELHMVPDQFYWDVQYGFGQTRLDVFGPVGPGNRQRTTVVATGPHLALPLGDRNSLEFGARVSERSYEKQPEFDGRLTTVQLGLVRAIDAVTRVSLNLEGRENEFNDTTEVYEFEIASLEYRRELASGQAIASVGRGRVQIGTESQPTTIARLAWSREVGARSRLEICAGRELTDAGSVFAAGGTAVGCQGDLSGLSNVPNRTDGRLQGAVSSTSPVRRESLGLRFNIDGSLANFSLVIGAAQDRFAIDSDFDNESMTAQLSATRQFGQQWLGEIFLRSWIQDFRSIGRNDDQSVRLALSHTLARSSRLEFVLERNRRVSERTPFDENVLFVSFGHNFGR